MLGPRKVCNKKLSSHSFPEDDSHEHKHSKTPPTKTQTKKKISTQVLKSFLI